MIFSEKKFRAFLVVGSAAVALGFFVLALSVWVNNAPLKPLAQARILGWEVEEVRSDRFALRARYAYDWDGKGYLGTTLFELAYFNEFSAVSDIKEAAGRSWSVWLDPSHPERSSLEKLFPSSLLVRAAISALVFFYFMLIYTRKYFKS